MNSIILSTPILYLSQLLIYGLSLFGIIKKDTGFVFPMISLVGDIFLLWFVLLYQGSLYEAYISAGILILLFYLSYKVREKHV